MLMVLLSEGCVLAWSSVLKFQDLGVVGDGLSSSERGWDVRERTVMSAKILEICHAAVRNCHTEK